MLCLCGDDDYEMLIISGVEICSKPMAILLYDDDFCVRVCLLFLFFISVMFVPACHGGSLEGRYFSMMICLCERSLLNWRDVKRIKEKDGDEEETRRLRGSWTMEKESRKGGTGEEVQRGGALFT